MADVLIRRFAYAPELQVKVRTVLCNEAKWIGRYCATLTRQARGKPPSVAV